MWAWPTLDRRALAAHAFLAHADVGGRIVTVVAPARVVERNAVAAVVRADRFAESQGADALPVVHRHARQPLDAALPAVVRHADVEHHGTARRRVARIEHVAVDLLAEIEMLAFNPALPLRHPEHQVLGCMDWHGGILAELRGLVDLAGVCHLVESLEDRAGAKHDEKVNPAAVGMHVRRVHELRIVDVRGAHAAEILLHDHAGRNQRRGVLRIRRRIDLHAEAERPALATFGLVALGRETADGQALRSLRVVAGVLAVLRDLPGAEDADAVRRDDAPPSLAVRAPAEVGLRIHRSGRGLPELVLSREQPAPRIPNRGPEQRQRTTFLTAGTATIRVLVEGLADLRVP